MSTTRTKPEWSLHPAVCIQHSCNNTHTICVCVRACCHDVHDCVRLCVSVRVDYARPKCDMRIRSLSCPNSLRANIWHWVCRRRRRRHAVSGALLGFEHFYGSIIRMANQHKKKKTHKRTDKYITNADARQLVGVPKTCAHPQHINSICQPTQVVQPNASNSLFRYFGGVFFSPRTIHHTELSFSDSFQLISQETRKTSAMEPCARIDSLNMVRLRAKRMNIAMRLQHSIHKRAHAYSVFVMIIWLVRPYMGLHIWSIRVDRSQFVVDRLPVVLCWPWGCSVVLYRFSWMCCTLWISRTHNKVVR